jgi:TPR repeat protein
VCRSLLFELPAHGKTRAFATKAAGRLVLRLDFLKNGGFASARILLRRAAESGNADAALLLGKTFDPSYLRELGAIGIEPDIAQCRQWYAKAAELASEAAAQRLANLAQAGR